MLNTGKGASVHEWTQEWDTKYVGFVRKCRKGVICLMEHDYTKEVCTCLVNHQTFFKFNPTPPPDRTPRKYSTAALLLDRPPTYHMHMHS